MGNTRKKPTLVTVSQDLFTGEMEDLSQSQFPQNQYETIEGLLPPQGSGPKPEEATYNPGQKLLERLRALLHFTPNSIILTIG